MTVTVISYKFQAVVVTNRCTPQVTGYYITIMFNGNTLSNSTVKAAINVSDYFPGHPLVNTHYDVTVSAVNSRGMGAANALPISKWMYVCTYYSGKCKLL